MKHSMRTCQRGFSLLELLVAFSIMALSLGMLYRAAGGSMHSMIEIERHQRAALLAQSRLSLRDSVSEDGWTETGESAGYVWQVRSAPYSTPIKDLKAVPLHEIAITISWGQGEQARQMNLSTLRPQRKPPAGAVVR